ncbi:MAG: hypothetical protein OXE92_07120, partial [Bacteroidetes bacterium]|nr:hypothetical protein [Bacteroidota bacterium]
MQIKRFASGFELEQDKIRSYAQRSASAYQSRATVRLVLLQFQENISGEMRGVKNLALNASSAATRCSYGNPIGITSFRRYSALWIGWK